MRRILNERDGEGREHRERVFRHLIEVATSWEVIIKGRDPSGDPIEVASARDAVEAAKLILGYDVGLPKKLEAPITVPDGLATDGRSLLEIVASIYRHRLVSGEMGESEFADMVKGMLSFDQAKVALILKLMGKNIAGKDPAEIQALLAGEKLPATISAESVVSTGARDDQASPKGCDTASHAQSGEETSGDTTDPPATVTDDAIDIEMQEAQSETLKVDLVEMTSVLPPERGSVVPAQDRTTSAFVASTDDEDDE
jgi:hypothetical protein